MSIKSILTEPSKNYYPKFIYGLLGLSIALLCFAILNTYTSTPPQRHIFYGNLAVSFMLILNIFAFWIRFNPNVTAALRILAMLWTIAVFVLSLSHYAR